MLTRIDFRSKPSTSVSQPTRIRNGDSISLPRLVLLLRRVSPSLQCLYVSIPSTFFYSLLTLATRIIGIPRCAFDLAYESKSEAEGLYPPPHLCFSTGSAGLIQTIRMYIGHHWVAAILGTLATVGWTIQGVGNAIYFVQVSSL